MTVDKPGAYVEQLSWPDVEARARAGAIGVLPVGASSKAHGPHLPMNADALQADYLAKALVESIDVLVWPTVTYGYYPAFTDYPGSVSLALETFLVMVKDILTGIEAAGIERILILNTGISTIKPLNTAVDAIRESIRIRLANVYDGMHYRRAVQAVEEQSLGGHADEIETSILLAIDSNYVDMEKAVSWTPATGAGQGPLSRSDSKSSRYSPSGVWGDSRLAGIDKGKRVLAAMLDDLMVAIASLQ